MHPLLIVLLIAELFWLQALVMHLKNKELDPTDKICWTVVLCVLNLLGLVLYMVFGPHWNKKPVSEGELKRQFNEGRR